MTYNDHRPVEDRVLSHLSLAQDIDRLMPSLTPRQKSIAAYLSVGMTQEEIRNTLGMSKQNVSRLVKAIYKRAIGLGIVYP